MPKFGAIQDCGETYFIRNGCKNGRPVPLSIKSTENRDARPFWMRAFTAHELFIDWFKSMPTCVTDLTCWS